MVGAETRRAPLPDRAVAPLKVFLLGRFEVVRGDAPIPHSSWRRRRPADLLKLTALTAGRVLSRERVIETLWPDNHDSAWLAAPRAELRARFASAALPLARASASAGDARRAIPLLRRLLDVEPVAEEPQLLLMRLLAEAGRRADALRQFDAAEAALRLAGLGPPAPELRELRERMLRGDIGPAHGRLAYDG